MVLPKISKKRYFSWMGYLGVETLYSSSISESWLRTILFTNINDLETIATNTSPITINPKIDFILINKIMIEDGFHVGWASYVDHNDDWIIKFPNIDNYLCYNSYIFMAFDSKNAFLLVSQI